MKNTHFAQLLTQKHIAQFYKTSPTRNTNDGTAQEERKQKKQSHGIEKVGGVMPSLLNAPV